MKTVDENRRVLWLMHALMLLIAVPSTLLGALTPYFTQRFSLTYTQIGMLGSAQGIGGIVSMLAGGLLSDRMPKLRLAGWVLLLLTGSAAGLCIVDSYPLLILFLALVQFSANLLDTVDNSQINVLTQRTMHRICTAATNEEVSFAYRVAIPRQRFRWRNAFSTRWRSL